MNEVVEHYLSLLLGKNLCNAGRSINLEWFHFGKQREIQDRSGAIKIVAEYALHVQCPWRITNGRNIIVGSGDRFYPSGDPFRDVQDFNWEVFGSNKADEKIALLLSEEKGDRLIVDFVKCHDIGGFSLHFVNKYQLEVFLDSSLEGEYWRFFEPYTTHPHLTMTHNGVETM